MKFTEKRRQFLGAVAAGTAVPLVSRMAHATTPFTMQTAWINDAGGASCLVGSDNGNYEDEMLEISYSGIVPDVVPYSSFISSNTDIALTTSDTTINAIVEQCAKFRIIGPLYQKSLASEDKLVVTKVGTSEINTAIDGQIHTDFWDHHGAKSGLLQCGGVVDGVVFMPLQKTDFTITPRVGGVRATVSLEDVASGVDLKVMVDAAAMADKSWFEVANVIGNGTGIATATRGILIDFNGRTFSYALAVPEIREQLAWFRFQWDEKAGTFQHRSGSSGMPDFQRDSVAELYSHDFGAIGDGVANDSVALDTFFRACIDQKKGGYIAAGTYLIDLGTFHYQSQNHGGPGKNPFPIIRTAGLASVIFKPVAAVDAPLFRLDNGPADIATVGTSLWFGGGIGSYTFDAVGKSIGVNQHCLMLRGVWGMRFGYFSCKGNNGDGLHIEPKLHAGSNPDPYNVALTKFEGIETKSNSGWALNNQNFVGFTGCIIDFLRAIESGQGGWYGLGTVNTVGTISFGSLSGWAIDDPDTAVGGASSRITVGPAEIDDCENGVRIPRADAVRMNGIRFVHRKSFSAANTSGLYWPRIALSLGNVSMRDSSFDITHRVEAFAGAKKADLGVINEYHNSPNISGLVVSNRVFDNAELGVNSNDIMQNASLNAFFKVTFQGEDIYNTLNRERDVLARFVGKVASAGWTTAAADLIFPIMISSHSRSYNAATGVYTSYATGLYDVTVQLKLALALGEHCRVAVMSSVDGGVTRSAAYGDILNATANNQYKITLRMVIAKNMSIWINADQNTGTPLAVTQILSPNENYLSISKV